MADRIAHPIEVAWISTGGTGAQNYDEFADDAEIEDIVRAQPASVLGVEMPHCTPEARAAGRSFAESLPAARDRLRDLRDDGRFRRVEDAVAAYRISGRAGTAYAVVAMVDTDQISDSADEPGRVIRNEDVFAEKVRERTELTRTLGFLLSPVLLLGSEQGAQLEEAVAGLIVDRAEPDITDTDQLDQEHEMWLVPPGEQRDRLLDLASAGELIVADGNHRSLSAQQAGLGRFLAVITMPGSVHIKAYNRLVRDTGRSAADLLARLERSGCAVGAWEGPVGVPALPGTVVLYLGPGRTYAVTLPPAAAGPVSERLDHAVVQRVLFGEVLEMAPSDGRISYIGGDYPPEWLAGEVDEGRADCAVLISPVAVDDFVAVNLAREKMPRKSTWFTPKARTGLVVAEVTPDPRPRSGHRGPE
jgi:uncharacterized protein (DUF1015 family)